MVCTALLRHVKTYLGAGLQVEIFFCIGIELTQNPGTGTGTGRGRGDQLG